MPNVKSTISRHNQQILSTRRSSPPQQKNCNCRKSEDCPLNNNCQSECIVYKAEVKTSNGETREYIGMTANSFKERYYNHKKSFNLEKYEKKTELSKFVWRLKRSNVNYSISWSILKRAPVFSSGGKRCSLCLEEKLYIMNADPGTLLNKRSEVFAKCRHREKWWAAKFKRARVREPGQNTPSNSKRCKLARHQ